jgi:hypothetical protein
VTGDREAAIAAWLLQARIAGPHRAHDREDNVRKAEALASSDAEATFGMSDAVSVPAHEALLAVAKAAGSGEPGAPYIDPRATVSGALEAADRLRQVCRRGAHVLIATGHPAGLLSFYACLGRALDRRGATLVRPLEDVELQGPKGSPRMRYLFGVGILTHGGSVLHSHSPWAMEQILDSARRIDLVIGDHGFAGAAVQAGIPTVGVMDTNDPALAVAWAAGREITLIPADDNRPPDLYLPLSEFIEERLQP